MHVKRLFSNSAAQMWETAKLASFIKPSLLRLPYPIAKNQLPKEVLAATTVVAHLEQASEDRVQVSLLPAVPPLSAQLIVATGMPGEMSCMAVPIAPNDWQFRICLLHRAKGPGFVEVGKDWGSEHKLFCFGDSCTDEGIEQAHQVAEALEEMLGYRMEIKDYGSDF